MRVFCYFNLHRLCFSVRALEGPDKGRVVAHADAVHLTDVTFKVSQAGRQRVLRERRKNVHAGAVGTLSGMLAHGASKVDRSWARRRARFEQEGRVVSYNPYRGPSFFECNSGTDIAEAPACLLQGKKALVLS